MIDDGQINELLAAAVQAEPAEEATPAAVATQAEAIQTGVQPVETKPVEQAATAPLATEAAKTEEPVQEFDEKKGGRVRLQNPEDFQLAVAAKSAGMSIADYVLSQAQHRQQQEPEIQPDPEPEQLTPLQQAQAALEEVRSTIDAAVDAEGSLGATLTPELRNLQKRESDLARQVAVLETQQILQQQAADTQARSQWDEADAANRELAFQTFPALAETGSPLHAAVSATLNAMIERDDPRIADPNLWFEVAAVEAAKLGVTPASAQKTTTPPGGQQQATQQPVPGVKSGPVFSPASGATTSSAHRIEVQTQAPGDQTIATLQSGKVANNLSDLASVLGGFFGSGADAGSAGLTLLAR